MANNKVKEAENKIRDILNLVAVLNKEELEGENKELSDDAAKQLKSELQKLAKIVSSVK